MLGQLVVQPLSLPDGEPAIVLFWLAVLLQAHRRDMVEPPPAMRRAQDRANQCKHLFSGAAGGRALILAPSTLHARLGHAEDQQLRKEIRVNLAQRFLTQMCIQPAQVMQVFAEVALGLFVGQPARHGFDPASLGFLA
ncbi:hypothetical protein [Xanthomonas hortorum]|uniref:Uncharacterized protein n=1 Tax=Xanthomonas hortorum pv. vitians TaxID=83224 RepID=A0AAW8ZQ18_9XANT|nr:hypothetical protein [Xanthomonas hortorum]MCE4302382.1 hypothetical protein [Xanthomonas hortorum pv. vitians]MDT7826213.1 hypothetical protein [Xanthomonas hortorum pv. vitians]MDV7248628.1 hypothetical protein [Xanthomonas hortorum pv. vitians]